MEYYDLLEQEFDMWCFDELLNDTENSIDESISPYLKENGIMIASWVANSFITTAILNQLGMNFLVCDLSEYGYDLQLSIANIISGVVDIGIGDMILYLRRNPEKIESLKQVATILRDGCDCAIKNTRKIIHNKNRKIFIKMLEEKRRLMDDYINLFESLKDKFDKK